jgi:subtilisin family serine protease
MTVFDELLNLLKPDRLLKDARATGEGVAVAVVDSGIDRVLLEEKHRVHRIEGALFHGVNPEVQPDTGPPSSPHGTTVADIILTIAPGATLFSADVFGPRGTCEVETVVAAIRHAMDVWKVKVINLSLGVSEQKIQQVPRRQQLLRVIEEAYFRDVIVFAAAHNDHPLTRSYPALFSTPLISVDKGLFADPLQYAYLLREQVEFQAHGQGYLGPFSREPATSWAAPHLTGIAARILSLKPDLKPFELKAILYWMFQASNPLGSTPTA